MNWIPKKKSWVLTQSNYIGKTNNFNETTASIHHHILSSNNTLSPCLRCNIKNPKLKTKGCYFQYDINKLYSLQIDSKKILHANFENLMLAHTTTENRTICNKPQTNIQLPRPLNAFSSFPLHIWNEFSKNNTKYHNIYMFISTHPHSPHNNN